MSIELPSNWREGQDILGTQYEIELSAPSTIQTTRAFGYLLAVNSTGDGVILIEPPSGIGTEFIEDTVANFIYPGNDMSVSYSDSLGRLTISYTGSGGGGGGGDGWESWADADPPPSGATIGLNTTFLVYTSSWRSTNLAAIVARVADSISANSGWDSWGDVDDIDNQPQISLLDNNNDRIVVYDSSASRFSYINPNDLASGTNNYVSAAVLSVNGSTLSLSLPRSGLSTLGTSVIIPSGTGGWNSWTDVDNPGSRTLLSSPNNNDELPIWDDSIGTWKRTRWQDLPSGGGGSGWGAWTDVPSPSSEDSTPINSGRFPFLDGSIWKYLRYDDFPSGGGGGDAMFNLAFVGDDDDNGTGWRALNFSWPAISEARWVLVRGRSSAESGSFTSFQWIQNMPTSFSPGIVGETGGNATVRVLNLGATGTNNDVSITLGASSTRGVLVRTYGYNSARTYAEMWRAETSVLDTMGRDGVTDLVSFDNTDRELTVRTTVGGHWIVSIPGTTGGGWTSWGQVPSPSGDSVSPASNVRIPIYTGSGWDYVRWSNLPSGGDGGPTAYIESLSASGNTLSWTDQDNTPFSWTPTVGSGGWTAWAQVPSPGTHNTSPADNVRIPIRVGSNWHYTLWENLPSGGSGGWDSWDDVDPPAFGQIVDNTLTRIPAYYSSTGAWGRQQPAGIVNAANESYDIITNASGWNDDDYIMTHSTVTADAGKQIHRSLVMGGSGWNWPLSRIFQGSLTSSTDVAVENYWR